MYEEQKEMYEQLSLYVPEIHEKFAEDPQNSFFWLMGRNVPDNLVKNVTRNSGALLESGYTKSTTKL